VLFTADAYAPRRAPVYCSGGRLDLLHLCSYTRPFIVNLNLDEVLCRGICIARFCDWRNVQLMLRHGFIASLLLVGSFVLWTTLTSIKTMAERPTFASDVRPILQSSCQPCHFQGGQMYEKLPFDKPETITKLGTKLFTRIKDEDQQRVIREFLSEQSVSANR
jgi:hypothetical protein